MKSVIQSPFTEFSFTEEEEIKISQVHPKPRNERDRVRALRETCILDTSPDESFDRYTNLAARFFKVPIALVSLVDIDRCWLKSKYGTEMSEGPRAISFCTYAVLDDAADVLAVEDATRDERFSSNPYVTDDFGLRFYAGAGIVVEGQKIGTLCLMDSKPRVFTARDRLVLRDMCALVEDLIRSYQKYFEETQIEVSKLYLQVLLPIQKPLEELTYHTRTLKEVVSKSVYSRKRDRYLASCDRLSEDVEFGVSRQDIYREACAKGCEKMQSMVRDLYHSVESSPSRHGDYKQCTRAEKDKEFRFL